MKKFSGFILLVFLSIISVNSQTKPSDITGVYRWCLIGCEAIKINADLTFDWVAYGDLQSGRTKGTWEVIGTNKILIKFPKEETETTQKVDDDAILIEVDRQYPTNINFTKVIKSRTLCNLDETGEITYCYKKLKNKGAKKLFSDLKSNE